MQHCEDKLASFNDFSGAIKDPKLLERVKNLQEETIAFKKPLVRVQQQATDLIHKANEQKVDAAYLQDEINSIIDRVEYLQSKLHDKCNELQSAATAVAQFTEQLKKLNQAVANLDKEASNLSPPGRDVRTVQEQIDETDQLLERKNKLLIDIEKLVIAGQSVVDSGFANDAATTKYQVEGLTNQLTKINEQLRNRKKELNDALGELQSFWKTHSDTLTIINDAYEEMKKFKPIGSEVDSIRTQQETFRAFKLNRVEPINRSVDNCNSVGQALIQSASRGVNTNMIEKDLDKLNEKWNLLKEKLNERDRKLDNGLLQSGKYQEALSGLEKWLADTEELVANQKPPSSDYKVAKAQLQEQTFLQKMLMDRRSSLSSLCNMGQEVKIFLF